jgi:L-asparaginase II
MSLSDAAAAVRSSRVTAFSGDVPLIEVIRGEFVESVHRGSIAVADAWGALVEGIGDVEERAFLRSGAKPFQVMPAVLTGGIDRFGITDRELAVLCASHTGEPRHVEEVLSVLGKIGLDESALRCGVHPPINPRVAADRWRKGLEPSPVCNNCSGAHAGMLVACVAAGWSIDHYGDPNHPLQLQIRKILAEFSWTEEAELEEAVDNCAVPTFRLPLIRSATAFARLASGVGVSDKLAGAARAVRSAMTTYPEMVGGEDRLDSDLMRAAGGDLVAKGGAEGFQGVGHTARGIGLALKVSDGGPNAANTATMRALSDAAMVSSASLEALDAYRDPVVLNMQGEIVGRVLPIFHLREYP